MFLKRFSEKYNTHYTKTFIYMMKQKTEKNMQTSYNQEPLLQFIITKFIIQKANLKELLDNHVLCTI